MEHNLKIKVLILSIITAITSLGSCTHKKDYIRLEGFAQGGTYHIIYDNELPGGERIPTSSEEVSQMVSKALTDIDFSLSGYNKSSIVSKVNNNEPHQADKYFTELFHLCEEITKETEGYFDISGAPLYDFWGFGFKNSNKMDTLLNEHSTKRIIDSLKSFIGMDKVRLVDGKVIKDDPRIKLNFNAIAQGYTCDVLARILDSLHVENYLIEVGMEIVCKGVNPSGNSWQIGIDTPKDGSQIAGESIENIVPINNESIVTSGNYRKFYILNGKKYAHSINPHTGYPVEHDLLSATIITSDGAHADAYATYCMVVGKEKATQFISERSDLKGYLITSSESINLLE